MTEAILKRVRGVIEAIHMAMRNNLFDSRPGNRQKSIHLNSSDIPSAMEPHPQLQEFMAPYDEEIQQLALQLRNYIVDLVPQANELIWDNYNAVAIAYSKSEKLKDAFCHLALYTHHVNFGFNRGAELTKTKVILEGKGKLIRHISVKDFQSFPKEELKNMIWEAVGIAEHRNKDLLKPGAAPKSIVMSISEKKIRPHKKTQN
ncbi:MAG: DUF1801 domain-containing protein [Allomuricauda sp.]|nr:MAG: DUF1801 domain-containing protein [Allomuricauda sp.]